MENEELEAKTWDGFLITLSSSILHSTSSIPPRGKHSRASYVRMARSAV